MTENHGFNEPDKGTTDWHILLNENFKSLDTAIEIRDSNDERDHYTPKEGAKFLAIDTHEVYLGDGASWNRIGTHFDSSADSEGGSHGSGLHQLLAEGYVVPVFNGSQIEESAIDPETTETPVQDAIDQCGEAEGGDVYLPPIQIDSPGDIVLHDAIGLYGTWGATKIKFDSGAQGLVFDAERSAYQYGASGYISDVRIDGIHFEGPWIQDTDSGPAVYDAGRWRNRIGRVAFTNWYGTLWHEDGLSFANSHDYIYIEYCDGAGDALFLKTDWGAPNYFNTIEAYPRGETSGVDSPIFETEGGGLAYIIQFLNLGAHLDHVFDGFAMGFTVNHCNYEPDAGEHSTPEFLFRFSEGSRSFHIRSIDVRKGDVRYVYDIEQPTMEGSLVAASVHESDANLLENQLRVGGRPNEDQIVTFGGHSGQIDEDSPESADNIAAVGDIAPAHRT